MSAAVSGFEAKLRAGHFVITAEIAPPLSSDRQHLLERAIPLARLADAVNITDGASARVHMSAVTAAGILVHHGIEPILQFTCRDRNRIALQSDLLGAAALGVRNLLLLTGDDPRAGDQPDAKPVFDLDSCALIKTAVAIRDKNELPSGRKIAGHADFFVGVADTLLDPPRRLGTDLIAKQDCRWGAVCPDSVLHGSWNCPSLRKATGGGGHHRTFFRVDRDRSAGRGPIGTVDTRASTGLDHSRRARRSAGASRRPHRGGKADLRRSAARAFGDHWRQRSSHYGAAQPGNHCRGYRRIPFGPKNQRTLREAAEGKSVQRPIATQETAAS